MNSLLFDSDVKPGARCLGRRDIFTVLETQVTSESLYRHERPWLSRYQQETDVRRDSLRRCLDAHILLADMKLNDNVWAWNK